MPIGKSAGLLLEVSGRQCLKCSLSGVRSNSRPAYLGKVSRNCRCSCTYAVALRWPECSWWRVCCVSDLSSSCGTTRNRSLKSYGTLGTLMTTATRACTLQQRLISTTTQRLSAPGLMPTFLSVCCRHDAQKLVALVQMQCLCFLLICHGQGTPQQKPSFMPHG